MPVLHNRISNDALKAKMLAESEPRTTISFYKYFHIAAYLRAMLKHFARSSMPSTRL